jgi:hypothetical protein
LTTRQEFVGIFPPLRRAERGQGERWGIRILSARYGIAKKSAGKRGLKNKPFFSLFGGVKIK